MILIIKLKNGSKICEEIRTAKVNKSQLAYYRKDYYTGGIHIIVAEDIESAYIMDYGEKVHLIS